jgi:AcrR family transcriptional regulator
MRDAEATRARLMATASRLFAERGFKRVTVREICRAARANVAAVNYHFGDKLGLYREIVQVAIDAIRQQLERAQAADPELEPEERLRRFLDYWLRRMSEGADEPLHRILQRETIEPTPVLDAIMRDALKPRFDYLCEVVAAMTGSVPSDPAVKRSVGCMHAQVVLIAGRNRAAERLGVRTPRGTDLDEVVRHVIAFTIAGIYGAAGRRM